jgi:hypothetical protein
MHTPLARRTVKSLKSVFRAGCQLASFRKGVVATTWPCELRYRLLIPLCVQIMRVSGRRRSHRGRRFRSYGWAEREPVVRAKLADAGGRRLARRLVSHRPPLSASRVADGIAPERVD